MKAMPHVYEPTLVDLELRGTWGPRVLVELACGGGAYTVGLAQRRPDAIVVGVDIKGSRMWWGARLVEELGLKNAKFFRTKIEQLADFFADGEVDEIWITFPNPHPTLGNAKRRLTSRRFLEIYRRVLKEGGLLHLKTDDAALFEFSKESLPLEGFQLEEVVEDVYGGGVDGGLGGLLTELQTQYEQKYLKEGRKIRYLRASRKA